MTELSKLLLAQYQLEYETSDISISELCTKYSIAQTQLKGHPSWTKKTKTLVPAAIVTAPQLSEPIDIKANIKEFKDLAVEHCLNFMKNDARYAEVKEFKDIVSIITNIEGSDKTVEPTTTVNVLVQNISSKFVDDC